MIYKGLQLTCPDDMDPAEAEAYADAQIAKWHDKQLCAVTIETDPDDPEFLIVTPREITKFERIRRITGYLVGNVNRWSNAKQAELRDRVKHE